MRTAQLAIVLMIFFVLNFSDAHARSRPDEGVLKGKLQIHVVGFNSDRGRVRFALYESAEDYRRRSGACRTAELQIRDGKCVWVIKNMPYGEYAVMLFHDENGNSRFDTNFFGFPKEKYGFSNNARPGFTAPIFEKVKFSMNARAESITINLQ